MSQHKGIFNLLDEVVSIEQEDHDITSGFVSRTAEGIAVGLCIDGHRMVSFTIDPKSNVVRHRISAMGEDQ